MKRSETLRSLHTLKYSIFFIGATFLFFFLIGELFEMGYLPMKSQLPPRGDSLKLWFLGAALVGLVAPAVGLALYQENKIIVAVLATLIMLLLAQILMEAIFHHFFFPSIVILIALTYIGHRLLQLWAALQLVRNELKAGTNATRFVKVTVITNLVFWSSVGINLLFFRLPLLFEA